MAGLLVQLPRPGMPGIGAPGCTRPFRVLAAALSALICKFMMGKWPPGALFFGFVPGTLQGEGGGRSPPLDEPVCGAWGVSAVFVIRP